MRRESVFVKDTQHAVTNIINISPTFVKNLPQIKPTTKMPPVKKTNSLL